MPVVQSPLGFFAETLSWPGSGLLSLNASGGGLVPLLGGAELLFELLGAVRCHQMDLEAKRHLVVTDGTVHGSSFCRSAIPTDSLVRPLIKRGKLLSRGSVDSSSPCFHSGDGASLSARAAITPEGERRFGHTESGHGPTILGIKVVSGGNESGKQTSRYSLGRKWLFKKRVSQYGTMERDSQTGVGGRSEPAADSSGDEDALADVEEGSGTQ